MMCSFNKNRALVFYLFIFLFTYSCKQNSQSLLSKTIIPSESLYKVNYIGQWMTEGKREHIVRDFAREYEFQNQEVKVNLKFPEEIGFDRYNTESTFGFLSQLFKRAVPEWDVVLINDDMEGIAQYIGDDDWAKKYLVDFSQFPGIIDNTIKEIDLIEVKKRWNGIIPGPFLEGQYWALWTNKNVAKKLGIEVKQYGMTFDDYLSYIEAVDKYNKVNTEKIVAFQEAFDWGTSFSIAIQLYISLVNDKEEVIRDVITARKLKAWHQTLKALEKMSVYQPLNADWRTATWNDNKSNLLNEKCLFFSNGSWMYNTWVEEDASLVNNCVPTEYPTFNKVSMYPGGFPIMWGVLKNSPNKDQAIRLLLAMNQPAMAEEWVRNTKCTTGIKGNLTAVSFGTDQFETFSNHIQTTYGKGMYKQKENSNLIFGSKYANEPNYFMEVLTGDLSADEAMSLIQNNMGKYLR